MYLSAGSLSNYPNPVHGLSIVVLFSRTCAHVVVFPLHVCYQCLSDCW